MSTCMDRLSQIIVLARSKKITDYKKAIKFLLEFWDDNSEIALNQITEFSKNRSSTDRSNAHSWNDIFVVVHELFMAEIERISKLSGNSGKLDKERIIKLIYITSDKAKNYLKPRDVVSSTLQVLNISEHNSYAEFYEMYLSILRKHVLQEASQRILVSPNQWQELLQACINILKKSIPLVDYVKLLEAVELIVQHGCSLSKLLFQIKSELLPVIGQLLNNYEEYNIKSTDILFKLTFTVCQQIAIDSRLTLRRFATNIPFSMVELKGPEEKYKLFLLFMQVHHPNGASLDDDYWNYAFNNDKWKVILNSLYKMILNDIIKPTKLSKDFTALACEVFRQIIFTKLPDLSQPCTLNDSLFLQPRKRRRMSCEQEKIIDLINFKDPERSWPLIQIAAALYKKYPDCLAVEEFAKLLDIVIKLMNQACKNFSIMEDICELALILVQNDERYKEDDLRTSWDKVWDALIRYLSMNHNETIQKGCALAQILISTGKISNSNLLLKLYLSNSIQWSNASIQALEVFCKNTVLPSDIENVDLNLTSLSNNSLKRQLLQWTVSALTKRLTAPLLIEDLSRTLIGLTLKSWYKPNENIRKINNKDFCINLEHNFYDDMRTINIEDIEKCYISLQLKSLQVDEKNKKDAKILNDDNSDNPYSEEDLDFLVNNLIQCTEVEHTDKDLSSFILKIALISKILSDLIEMKMIICNFDEFCLVNEFKTCLTRIYDQLKNVNWLKSIRFTLEVTKALILLYKIEKHAFINEIILTSTNFPVLKKIYEISKIYIDEFESNAKHIYEYKINAIIVLTQYCCINAKTDISEQQIKIMSTLLKAKKYNLSIKADVISVVSMLKIFSSVNNDLITAEFMELLLRFIMEIYEEWHKDDKVSRCILQVLPKVMDKIVFMNDKDNLHNVFLICKLFHNQFTKNEFGQLTQLSLVKCLHDIIQHKGFANNESNILSQETFITFLKSPYYVVRLESLKYVNAIFSLKELPHNWKTDFFNKLVMTVDEIFVIERQVSHDDILDEQFLRSISALQILATVICSKSTFQSPALYALLRIVVDKDISCIRDFIIKNILIIINKNKNPYFENIIEENLNYLITSWCKENNLDNFPYSLLNCSNEGEFQERYIDTIFPVLFREGKIQDARSLCNKLNVPFQEIFKKTCSNIIPWVLMNESADILDQLQNNKGAFKEVGNFSNLVKNNLQHIILHLVERLHDFNHFYEIFETTINLPASNPPYYNCDGINGCFERLMKIVCPNVTHSIFYYVILHNPSIFQKILLHLVRNVYSSKINEFIGKALHQYVFFCSKLVDELKENNSNPVATYFVKDICCTLLNFTRENEFLTKLACTYLHKFFKCVLPKKSKEVSNIMGICVKVLTSLEKTMKKYSKPKELLIYLLKDEKHCLAEAIENLGSLPTILRSDDNCSKESQFLREDLRQFLNASDDQICSVDDLLSLKRQLISKQPQLQELYKELEFIQGFAEECASSLLHRLIYRLIKLTQSADQTISLEAAKCLGILGPADLTTLILHPQETQNRETIDKADVLTYKVCQVLADLVVSADITLREASSEALYSVLESPWGVRLSDTTDQMEVKNYEFLMEFLYLFQSRKKKTSSSKVNIKVDIEGFQHVFDDGNTLWTEKSSDFYNLWISDITSAIANCLGNFYSKSLVPVFKLNIQFCEATLPRLLSLIINSNSNLATKICHCINRFFDHHFGSDINDQVSCCSSQRMQGCTARDAVRCMLDVINYLRIQTREETVLDFDYLPIAMAAQVCSAYFSSVLYAELWCRSNLKIARDFDSIPIIDQIYEQENTKGKIVQNILKEAYMKIGDLDSIHGCGSSHLQDRKSRISYYSNFQKVDKLILSHDIALSVANSSARGMVNALRDSSLHYLAKHLSSSTSTQVDAMEDLSYDSLWRLSDWNQVTNLRMTHTHHKTNNFSIYHYETLKCLHENDISSLEKNLEQARFCIVKDLGNISLESCKAVYPKLSQLQMLKEIEELNLTDPQDYQNLINAWEKQNYICNNNFQYIEPILTQRAVMFQIRDTIKNNPTIKNNLINVQLKIARLAQEHGYLNVAARALETLAKQVDLNEDNENRLLYHEAHLAWLRKDEDMARFILRSLIKKDCIKPSLLAQALRVYGNWIAESKSENPQAIINNYYEKAIHNYMSMNELHPDDLRNGCKARSALAQFAHEQYLVITDYIRSPQFESLKECIDYSRNAIQKNPKTSDRDVAKAVTINTRQSSNDSLELENIQKDKAMYLSLAIKNYLLTLEENDEQDFLIFRLISLWLDNIYDEEVNKLLERQLGQIPSYKFISLVPQLAPHMSNVNDIFTKKIFQILERCAQEHPHHTLPVLLALKNLYNDSKYCGKKITKQESRVLGAQQLIQQLLSTSIRPIIQEMDKLSDALVMLAYYETDKKSSSRCSIPRHLSIHNIIHFEHTIVPTLVIDVKKNRNYTNIVSIKKYESCYNNVGGINAPKKIICIGTDGIERPQLIKGKDDLRQDAVMQQVFTVMNSLLKSNKEARQKRLHVYTYKVVPLTQRSGVLQWCENTVPLSLILTGDNSTRTPGLHRKYYPGDYAPYDCRKRLTAVKDVKKRYKIFMDCCKNLHPAFHHFFTESYLSPETWFERRLAYTRSVATSSIIGYILGLGDRHVSNILIDKSTAEVVHIDFGIAFEQGKVLPTPETVPFRLTRDIEVAMGVSGVEGTMRRCCEETMTVLREQKEIIVTLLRVLLYDPLYSWAITPAKAATYQSEYSSHSSDKESNSPIGVMETNKLAERALLRVQQKLQGIEEGVVSSIAGQVERLIQQARDPTNLSRLFEGWQAYL